MRERELVCERERKRVIQFEREGRERAKKVHIHSSVK